MIGFKEAFDENRPALVLRDLTAKIFEPGGYLQAGLGLEHRKEQEGMANNVAMALSDDCPLLFEAGTGTGKSLAYLIPSIIHAISRKRQGIISTHTISLQEQVNEKDLKLCRALFNEIPELEEYKDFRAAVLIGKGNYLCTTRLAKTVESPKELFQPELEKELERIFDWSQQTKTGIVHELDPMPHPEVWESVNADYSGCNGKNCNHETCFYQKARMQTRKANLIIVNHSLLFALLGAGMGPGKDAPGILYPNDFLILDEAHTVPAVATEHFGHGISSYSVGRVLRKLYNPKTKKGLIARHAQVFRPEDKNALVNLIRESEVFFSQIASTLLMRKNIVRVQEEGWCDTTITTHLRSMIQRLGAAVSKIEDGPAKDELKDQRDRLQSIYAAINECASIAQEEHVYWVEQTGKRNNVIMIRSAPIDVADDLRRVIMRRDTGVIMTSATLSDGSTLKDFERKVGGIDEFKGMVQSPFDYEKNMRVYVASDAPLPSPASRKQDLPYLAAMIEKCCLKVSGGSLVLFTSYSDMFAIANDLESVFASHQRTFLMQGRGGSRTELTQKFARDGKAILFGTDSFWTGVDVPGPSLSQVIIVRLPFDNPSHPIPQARADKVKEAGGIPFLALTLPEALIKFRQGIGRLIRKGTDQGCITILDSRTVKKQYGNKFITALPHRKFNLISLSTLDEVFKG